VVFRADGIVAGRFELWRAPTDGSGIASRLSGNLVVGVNRQKRAQ
jgi:hypothetical protein